MGKTWIYRKHKNYTQSVLSTAENRIPSFNIDEPVLATVRASIK